MLLVLALSMLSELLPAAGSPRTGMILEIQEPTPVKAEYEKRRAEAEGDVDKLFELARWCEQQGLKSDARICYLEVVKLDKEHIPARQALGHVKVDGRWFTTQKKADEYVAEKQEKEAKDKGLVRYKDAWVDPADVPFLEKGMVRNEDGAWIDAEEKRKLDEGWKRQDLLWVSPQEIPNLEKGLWKCGDAWLAEPEADAYHAVLDRWWEIPARSGHVLLKTTLPRKKAEEALSVLEKGLRELARAYGVPAPRQLDVIVLNSVSQYQSFAGGDANAQRPGTVASGLDSVHGACFADSIFAPDGKAYFGAGLSYWDPTNTNGNLFGAQFARHALGQSYAQALDPSPKALAKFFKAPDRGFDLEAFYAEKKIPTWFRFGAATYAERYMNANLPGEAPDALRKWSVQNLQNKGGLDPLSQMFKAQIRADDPGASGKLINQLGLAVAFVLDGKHPPVEAAHAAVKSALQAGQDPSKAFAALAAEIEASEAQLRAFAGL